jgi:hypothetical protein
MNFTIVTPFGSKVVVPGEVWYENKVINTDKYEEILWVVDVKDNEARLSPQLIHRKLLIIHESDAKRYRILNELY